MKIKIMEDEFYPYYYLFHYGIEVNLPKKEIEKINKIMKDFHRIQEKLANLRNYLENK